MDDHQEIQQIYTSLKTNGERYKPLWNEISRVSGITVDPDYIWTNSQPKDIQLDQYVDDPTAQISVNQAGDYMLGIMWGTGEGVVDLTPSDNVKELVDPQIVAPWYSYATNRFLWHMNHPDCGYITHLRPYAYDQFSFGTSGLGLFKNQSFLRGVEENCIIARGYGIDNTRIAEGKSGAPDIGSAIYHWSVSRIIGEFCCPAGAVDMALLGKMPKSIQDCWAQKDFIKEFDLVFMWMPRKDWDPRLKGIRGARYRGVWFLDNQADNKIFFEESFKERPINMARMIKVRGEVYGRSSGTLLLSSIRSVNFIFAVTAEILEKMAQPPIGVFGNSIFGDSVLDTSPDGLTVFNATQMAGQLPAFPIHDVGDPSGIIKFLMPYLNEKITTAFKIDVLLDFNNKGGPERSATEMLQRYAIRGKSLAGMLGMQKIERLIPDARRGISICLDVGELGVNPRLQPDRAKKLLSLNKTERIIPPEVLEIMESGKPWYDLRWNNELEKLIRAEEFEALGKMIQSITALIMLYPPLAEAIKWYELLNAINEALGPQNQILVTAKEFKDTIAKVAAEKRIAMQYQMAQAGATVSKDNSTAVKNHAEAQDTLNAPA